MANNDAFDFAARIAAEGFARLPHQYDFSLDWTIRNYGSGPGEGLNVCTKSPEGFSVVDLIANFDRKDTSAVRALVDHHNKTVQMLMAHIDELQSGPRHGWSFLDDDGNEWSEDHPVKSGEHPYAEDVQPCTLREFWSAR